MKKKVVAVLLMVSMVAALAIGCGSKKEGGSEKNEGTTEKTKYEQIMEKGVLTIGTEGTYKPFTYHDDKDELTGYDVEVAKAIGEKMGVKVEFSEITWEGLLASMDNGTVDLVLNQVGVTDERKEKYDFSTPYLYRIESIYRLIPSPYSNRHHSTHMELPTLYSRLEDHVPATNQQLQNSNHFQPLKSSPHLRKLWLFSPNLHKYPF